jgi:molybdopterin-guanine dinucleotide biosynthesis protein A
MGRDKATLRLDGSTLLERTIRELQRLSDDVLVIGRTLPAVAGLRSLRDERADGGPVGGLLTGLRSARHPIVIAAACDHPFLSAVALAGLVRLAPGYDAVVPRQSGRPQPLHAVYSKGASTHAETYIGGGGQSLRGLLSGMAVRWVDDAELAWLDPSGRSLLNVNTPDEWSDVSEISIQSGESAGRSKE